MASFVCCGILQAILSCAEVLNGGLHVGLSARGFPAAAPAASSPITPAPANEQRAIDDLAFTVLEHALVAIALARVDTQHLDATPVGIHAHKSIVQAETA